MTAKYRASAGLLGLGLLAGSPAAAAAVISYSAAPTVLWQTSAWQQQSRWQEHRFGPIIGTDTLWTIASYYARQQGLSVYDMMDVIVAANPRVFIDNRPDYMLSGFYLVIPLAGPLVAQPQQAQPQQAQPQLLDSDSAATDVNHTIQFKAAELRDLRDQLASSISLIEQLQNENISLQARLNDLTAELDALKTQVADDRAIDQQIDAMAGELVSHGASTEASQEPAGKVSTAKFSSWLAQPPQLYVLLAVPLLLLLLMIIYMVYMRRIKAQLIQQTAVAVALPAAAESPAKAANNSAKALPPKQPAARPKRTAKAAAADLSEPAVSAEQAAADDHYISIDTLLNDADNVDFNAEQMQVSDAYDSAELALGVVDESNTPAAQLDLVQAYMDMGEMDEARALLQMIIGCDDADAEREAALLLQQLDKQSGR